VVLGRRFNEELTLLGFWHEVGLNRWQDRLFGETSRVFFSPGQNVAVLTF